MAPFTETEGFGILLVQVCRAHRNKAQELLGRVDLYPGQEFLLASLSPRDGLTCGELAGALCVQPATVTRMLQRMERTGLVETRPDPVDQRVSRVYLTPQGRGLLDPVDRAWEELERASLAGLSAEERRQLRTLLGKVYRNLAES